MREQSQQTDGELLSAVVEDPQAFLGVFERHFEAVHRFISRQLGSGLAEDAAAEVFLQALRSAHTFAPESADARPWLLGIATNVIRGELRRRYAGYLEPIESVERVDAPVQDDPRLDAVGRLAEVQRALTLVPIDDREPLLLYAWLDLPYEEIALALGLPVGTVRSRIARARRRLRIELGYEPMEIVSDGAYEG